MHVIGDMFAATNLGETRPPNERINHLMHCLLLVARLDTHAYRKGLISLFTGLILGGSFGMNEESQKRVLSIVYPVHAHIHTVRTLVVYAYRMRMQNKMASEISYQILATMHTGKDYLAFPIPLLLGHFPIVTFGPVILRTGTLLFLNNYDVLLLLGHFTFSTVK
jgi:hypothetical protein